MAGERPADTTGSNGTEDELLPAAAAPPRDAGVANRRAGIRTYVRWTVVAIVVATVVGASAGLFAISSVSASVNRIVNSLDPLQRDNAAVLRSLTLAESSIHDYELTGNATLLEQFRAGVGQYNGEIQQALALVGGDQRAAAAIETVQAQTLAWLALATHLAATPPQDVGGVPAASNLQSTFASVAQASAAATTEIADEVAAAQANANRTETVAIALVAAAAAFALLLALGFSLAARRRLVLPLEQLVGSIRRLRAGDRTARVEPDGPAEVRAAGQALNALAERLIGDDRRRLGIRALSDLITRDVREHVDLTTLLNEVAASIGIAFDADRVLVRLTNDGVVGEVAGQWQHEGLSPLETDVAERPGAISSLLTEFEARNASYVIEDSLRLDERLAGPDTEAYFSRLGLRAAVITPVTSAGELVGNLVIVTGTPRRWQEDEVGLIEVAAGEIGRAVLHAQLFSAQRELVAQLFELDRSKSEFLSNVSHELRTPLTSIAGYVEMLEEADAGPVNEQQLRMLQIVDRNARRLRALIEDLLMLSRIEAGAFRLNLEPVDLAEVIETAAGIVEPELRDKGLVLEQRVDDDLGLVLADHSQLERALLNLLSNAVKFTAQGGTVTIGATRDDAEVRIAVADTGIGIPVDEVAQLSTRFFRASNATERAIPGTGLGLSIVRSIVEHHGGALEIDSELGSGTRFVIRLPAERLQPRGARPLARLRRIPT